MKTYFLILIFLPAALFAQVVKKDVRVFFNPAKLSKEMKGNATLFRYRDPNCKYVVHEPGAPVLPCLKVFVLMPKGAAFKSCSIRAEAIPLCGTFKLYCKTFIPETAFTAKRFPPKLAEFVEQKDINGYRVFVFRTYPITCQPGDNTVNKILHTSLSIKYFVPENAGLYNAYSTEKLKQIKKLVVNPDDLSDFSAANVAKSSLNDPLKSMRDSLSHEIFATKIDNNSATAQCPKYKVKQSSVIDDLMQDQLFIDDNDIVYAPITF